MKTDKTWIVTRHPGAVEFLAQLGFEGEVVAHLDVRALRSGDRVVGTIPLQIAAQLIQRGIRYWHLCVPLTPADRGRELSAERLAELCAQVRCYNVQECLLQPTTM